MTLNDKQISRQIEKRRSSIVSKMNAFIAQENPRHGSPAEYVLWITAYCQIISYLIDKIYDHDDKKLEDVISILRLYHQESKEMKIEKNHEIKT